MYIFNEFCYKEIHLINMSLLDHVNWDFGAIRGAFCCCVGSLSSFYTAAGCGQHMPGPGGHWTQCGQFRGSYRWTSKYSKFIQLMGHRKHDNNCCQETGR